MRSPQFNRDLRSGYVAGLFCIALLLLFISISGCVDSDEKNSYVPGGFIPTISPSDYGYEDVTVFVGQLPLSEPLTPSPTPSVPLKLLTEDTTQVYRWYYKNAYYTWTIHVPADRYNYFVNLPRDKPGPADYVMSDRGRSELHQIMEQFISLSAKHNLKNDEQRDFVIAFVQSLPNNRWGSIRNYDDYPKYPLQTLYDGGGDSQDTSILLTSLLRLFGYQASILDLKSHYAVLLPQTQDDKINNRIYVYQNDDGRVMKGNYINENDQILDFSPDDKEIQKRSYTYIESNMPGYPPGTIPIQFRATLLMTMRDIPLHLRKDAIEGASIVHPKQYPDADFIFNARLIHLDQRYAYYQVYCTLTSIGTGPAKDLRININANPLMGDGWRFNEMKAVSAISEGDTRLVEATVQIPRNTVAEIECVLSGPLIPEKRRMSQVFYT
ncbi:MAG: hypothetical protein Q7J09_10550 [Methanocalculus sp.]|uniref:hypothetical protein n=1 Tax=Methanocalculus sp. TaxID=2004547 RepID=UPI00271DEDA4|nr:hypothetical protein [Methanocalculus sp.]MDO9540422.1 hypothetical protein [Methanocalculus sp.]